MGHILAPASLYMQNGWIGIYSKASELTVMDQLVDGCVFLTL